MTTKKLIGIGLILYVLYRNNAGGNTTLPSPRPKPLPSPQTTQQTDLNT